jgi:hypothetical protein
MVRHCHVILIALVLVERKLPFHVLFAGRDGRRGVGRSNR